MIERFIRQLHDAGDDPTQLETYRPALRRLTIDANDLVNSDVHPSLSGGFDSRTDLIHWLQRLATRSLGEVPQVVFYGMAEQLANPDDTPLVLALLDDPSMDADTCEHWRKRVQRRVVFDAFDRAYRRLRVDATEYLNEADVGGPGGRGEAPDRDAHDPMDQPNIAMRPSVEELDSAQRFILSELLPDGLNDTDEILDWGNVLVNATHGEPIHLPDETDVPVATFVDRLYERNPFAEMMVDPRRVRVREDIAAKFLLPTFNLAVRKILPTSGELPAGEKEGHGPAEVA